MQQRRFRPGDVLDDYCPRERRLTDHAIVAMIDERIQLTRCCVCDAEHEYKDGKVPAQRGRKPRAALFSQVLEGLQGPHPRRATPEPAADSASNPDVEPGDTPLGVDEPLPGSRPSEPPARNGYPSAIVESGRRAAESRNEAGDGAVPPPAGDEGSVRRSLIRATLPRPEGQPPATRAIPEFTIRQPNNARAHRPRRRGRQGAAGQGHIGPMRFGRDDGHGFGNGNGPRPSGGGRHEGGGARSRHRRGKKR